MPERTAKKTAAKKATARQSEPKPKREVNLTATVGTTIELDVDETATAVEVERPDGSSVTVTAAGGRALYVLDQVGVHIAGGLVVDAEADKA